MLSVASYNLKKNDTLNVFSVAGGQGCTAYDIIVHPDFLEEIKGRQILMGFFITIILEGIESKYDLELDRGTVIRVRPVQF